MRRYLLTLILCLMSCALFPQPALTSLHGFPTVEPGYELGVSACYAAVVGDELIVAGGCNFPEVGKKRYYRGVYAARLGGDSLRWRLIGNLPEPAAYGGTAVFGDSVLFVGGMNGDHSLATVVSLVRERGGWEVKVKESCALPCAVDNIGVAAADGRVYVFGGNQGGSPSKSLLCLHLQGDGGWERMPDAPGNPRVQPVLVAASSPTAASRASGGACEALYAWGGFFANGKCSAVETSGLRFDVGSREWHPLPAPRDTAGRELTLTGGAAVAIRRNATAGLGFSTSSAEGLIVAMGGVNRDIFLDAISGRHALVTEADYLKQPVSWYRFSGNLLCFSVSEGRWLPTTYASPRLARAGAQLVLASPALLCIGGELKPGVRTPEIVGISGFWR